LLVSMILGVMAPLWNGRLHVLHLATTSFQCHASHLSDQHLIFTIRM
jgi:hypothetical protein